MSENTETGRLPRAALAIAIPLAGLALIWIAILAASYSDLFTEAYACPTDPNGACLPLKESVRLSTYINFAGIAALCLSSLYGKKVSETASESRFTNAARGFTTVAVIASLITTVFMALGVFIQHLDQNLNSQSAVVSLLGTYLPIILYALLVLYVVLQAFVWKKDEHDGE